MFQDENIEDVVEVSPPRDPLIDQNTQENIVRQSYSYIEAKYKKNKKIRTRSTPTRTPPY